MQTFFLLLIVTLIGINFSSIFLLYPRSHYYYCYYFTQNAARGRARVFLKGLVVVPAGGA